MFNSFTEIISGTCMLINVRHYAYLFQLVLWQVDSTLWSCQPCNSRKMIWAELCQWMDIAHLGDCCKQNMSNTTLSANGRIMNGRDRCSEDVTAQQRVALKNFSFHMDDSLPARSTSRSASNLLWSCDVTETEMISTRSKSRHLSSCGCEQHFLI